MWSIRRYFVPMNVVSYIRVSGKGQLDGDGPERQRDSVRSLFGSNNLVLIREFFEQAISGTVDGMDRPAFATLIESHANWKGSPNEFEAIVVERMDRLARDLMVQEFLLKECRDRNIKVFAADVGLVDQATNDCDPTRTLIRQVLGAVAQFAKSELVLKMSKARARIREATGRCEGQKPFGFRAGEKNVLEAIQSYRAMKFTFEQIAGFLNQSNLPTRAGNSWDRRTVFSVWKNHIKQKGK